MNSLKEYGSSAARGAGYTMKAIVHDTYGLTDVLELRDIDKPGVGDHDVLVRAHSAGVNMGVWHLMRAAVPDAHHGFWTA